MTLRLLAGILRLKEPDMPDLEPLTLTIRPDHSQALREAVAEGEYSSIDDAVAEALATWQRRHEERAEELAWMRAKVQASLADPDPDLSEEEVDERLRRMFEQAERQADEAA